MSGKNQWWDKQIETFGYPLIACSHNGGPYDTEAFVAGMYVATINVLLDVSDAEDAERLADAGMAPTQAMPQMDLVALKHGYVMHHAPIPEHPGWSRMGFVTMTMEDFEIGRDG